MSGMSNIIIIIQVLSALAIIGLVLLQHGKGADMGAAFGSGASGSLFGSSGSSSFLSKSTGVAAAVFFAATLALAMINNRHAPADAGVMDNVTTTSTPVKAPVARAPEKVEEPASLPTLPGKAGQIPK